MTRKEKMLVIMKLDEAFSDFYCERFNTEPTPRKGESTPSWLEKKFDRFYLVESVRHNQEDFSVEVELRYGLRSQEANKYGRGHQAFHDRYLSTMSVDIKYLEDPEAYIQELKDELIKTA